MVKNVLIGILVFTIASISGSFIAYTMMNNRASTVATENTVRESPKKDKDTSSKEIEKKEKKEDKKAKSEGMSSEEKNRLIAEVSRDMEVTKDDMTGFTYYNYPTPKGDGIFFGAEVATMEDKNKAVLFPVAIYRGDDWIFFEGFIFKADNERFNVHINKLNKTDDVRYGGGVYEIYNNYSASEGESMEKAMRKIANATSVKMRFVGKYDEEREMTSEEIKHIANMVKLYDLLKK